MVPEPYIELYHERMDEMVNMDEIIADRITAKLREKGKKQDELEQALNISKQTMRGFLTGEKTIPAVLLERTAEFLNVPREELVSIPDHEREHDVISSFMEEVHSKEAKDALKIVDELADLVVFHAKVRENAEEMMMPWSIESEQA